MSSTSANAQEGVVRSPGTSKTDRLRRGPWSKGQKDWVSSSSSLPSLWVGRKGLWGHAVSSLVILFSVPYDVLVFPLAHRV